MPPANKPRASSAKASKPELKPLDEHLAALLSPALNRNRLPPVENAPVPAVKKSGRAKKAAMPPTGFGEAPQAGFTVSDAAEIDPRLAQALGLNPPEDGPLPEALVNADDASLATDGVSATVST